MNALPALIFGSALYQLCDFRQDAGYLEPQFPQGNLDTFHRAVVMIKCDNQYSYSANYQQQY